jgi:Dolichyl-phosphate-mannose-protein mannosyltransferase
MGLLETLFRIGANPADGQSRGKQGRRCPMSMSTLRDRETMGPEDAAHHGEIRRQRGLIRVALPALVVACVLVRLGLIDRQGLWVDELYSLANATGHSLEHPADRADPALGDFTELSRPSPPAAYSRYLEHEDPPASPARVVRAVLLSDVHPPLYYLVLYAWTRLLGTSDAALRSLSVVWALGCLPLLVAMARHVGGRRSVIPALALFTFAPECVYYSTEGRMYSMLFFLSLATAWLTLQLHRRGPTVTRVALWIAASVAGLLTHYFYALPWLAFVTWLLISPGRSRRGSILGAALAAAMMASPWYVQLPEILGRWRVTQDWIKDPSLKTPLRSAFRLVWSYVSAGGGFGKRNLLTLAAVVPMITLIARRGGPWFSARRMLLWSWLAAALLEPAIFDLLRGTGTMSQPRYVLAGMPAAYLLIASGLGRLRRPVRLALLLLLIMPWLLGIGRLYLKESRSDDPFRQLGRGLANGTDRSCLVIVHSIPSGVAGIARYMEEHDASAKGIGFASWVGQLKQRRVPEDLRALAAGRRRIILVNIHAAGEPAPEEAWLRKYTTLARSSSQPLSSAEPTVWPLAMRHAGPRVAAQVLEFLPRDSKTFFDILPTPVIHSE